MNSSAWHNVRQRKLTANPICEECLKAGKYTPAQCVHHFHEIESTRTDKDAWDVALAWNNLQSLCFACHRRIHDGKQSHSKTSHLVRQADSLERWKRRHEKKEPPG